MGDKPDNPSSKPGPNDKSNDEYLDRDRRYEVLMAASANIALTMLHRGRFLEDELKRALDHVRTSNDFLEKFVELLESVDEERRDGGDGARSWKEVAERLKSVVRRGGRRDGRRDDEKQESTVVEDEKGESDAAPSFEGR